MKKIWLVGFLAAFLSVSFQTVRAQSPGATTGSDRVVGENGITNLLQSGSKEQKVGIEAYSILKSFTARKDLTFREGAKQGFFAPIFKNFKLSNVVEKQLASLKKSEGMDNWVSVLKQFNLVRGIETEGQAGQFKKTPVMRSLGAGQPTKETLLGFTLLSIFTDNPFPTVEADPNAINRLRNVNIFAVPPTSADATSTEDGDSSN